MLASKQSHPLSRHSVQAEAQRRRDTESSFGEISTRRKRDSGSVPALRSGLAGMIINEATCSPVYSLIKIAR